MKITFVSLLLTAMSVFATHNAVSQTRIIVYSKCPWYKHEVIPQSVETLKALALQNKWQLTFVEDSTQITKQALKKTDILIFLYTNGPILNNTQKECIAQFVESGKSILTIHSGTSTENDWPWYQQAIGAKFTGHPPVQSGRVIIENKTHPSMLSFPSPQWTTNEEWFSFDHNPRNEVVVLASVDETSYNVSDNSAFKHATLAMGDHPIIWYKQVGKGIVYQCSLGHTKEMIRSFEYQQHLVKTIDWLSRYSKK